MGGQPHALSWGLCQPRADHPPGGHPGQAGPGPGVGGLRHHEQQLGLLRVRPVLQARPHAHQKAGCFILFH